MKRENKNNGLIVDLFGNRSVEIGKKRDYKHQTDHRSIMQRFKQVIGYSLLSAFIIGMGYKLSDHTDNLEGSSLVVWLMGVIFLIIILGVRRVLQD